MSLLTIRFRSKKLATRIPLHVLLPDPPMGTDPAEFYRAGEKYRVLWLLHGGTETSEDFFYKYHLHTLLRGHKVIAVMPNALNSDFQNHMGFGSGFPFIDFFFEELMPFVYATFPASTDPADNYLAGYSMGGSGASMLGFLHPEKFQGGIAPLGSGFRGGDFLGPYLHMNGSEFRTFALNNPTLFPTTFGDPAAGIKLKEINMIAHYDTVRDYVDSPECTWKRFPEAVAGGKLPELYFCCGELDTMTLECDQKILALAEELGFSNISLDIIPNCTHPQGAEIAMQRMIEHFHL